MKATHTKTATVCAVSAGEAPGYAWIWRSASHNAKSASAFRYYYDAVSDAREHGYTVEMTQGHGAMAPGGTYSVSRPGG